MPILEVHARGPLFNGMAEHDVAVFINQAVDAIAQQAFAEVHQILNANIKNPTPYYETQIMVQTLQDDRVVHDRGIIYGPWLEGVSSRNKETRFKGYAAFRRATQRVQGNVPQITAPLVKQLLHKLGEG